MKNFSYIQEFNPKLIGYALKDGQTSELFASQLNVAEIGAISRDIPFMAKYLIIRMRHDTRIDINKHWKVCILNRIFMIKFYENYYC